MRQFVVLGHEVSLDGEVSLSDLPGAGRLDLLARAVGAALFLSHGIREDARVHLVCRDEATVTVDGSDLRNARPDERSLGGLLRGALDRRGDAIGHQAVESAPGVTVRSIGLEVLLEDLSGTLVWLHEDGDPVVAADPPADPVFVLSDHRAFSDCEADLLADRVDRRASLGPEAIHADHAIAVAHNYCDTEGFSEY